MYLLRYTDISTSTPNFPHFRIWTFWPQKPKNSNLTNSFLVHYPQPKMNQKSPNDPKSILILTIKLLYTYVWKMLPVGALIWLALIWLIWARIAQPTSYHLKSNRWGDNFYEFKCAVTKACFFNMSSQTNSNTENKKKVLVSKAPYWRTENWLGSSSASLFWCSGNLSQCHTWIAQYCSYQCIYTFTWRLVPRTGTCSPQVLLWGKNNNKWSADFSSIRFINLSKDTKAPAGMHFLCLKCVRTTQMTDRQTLGISLDISHS